MVGQARTRSGGGRPPNKQVARYLNILGLEPGATEKEISRAHFEIKKALAEERSAEAHKLAADVDHAFRVLKARNRPAPPEAPRRPVNRFLLTATVALALLSVPAGYLLSNRLRPYVVSFEPGDRLVRANDRRRFGTVLFGESDHQFPDGSRADAYRIPMEPTDQEIRITARAATKALRAEVLVGEDPPTPDR